MGNFGRQFGEMGQDANVLQRIFVKCGVYIVVGCWLAMTFVAPFSRATDIQFSLLEVPVRIMVTPINPTLQIGETLQFTATAQFADNSTLNVTNDVLTTWNSTQSTAVGLDNSALGTALQVGSSIISASYGGVTGQTSVEVVVLSGDTPPPSSGGITSGGSATSSATASETPVEPPGDTPEVPGDTPTEPTERPLEPPPSTTENTPPDDGRISSGNPLATDQLPPAIEQIPSELPGPPPPGSETLNTPVDLLELTVEIPEIITEEIHTTLENVFLPDELGVTRGEIMVEVVDRLRIADVYEAPLSRCSKRLEDCFSIFQNVTNYDDVRLAFEDLERSFKNMQLYPDVSLTNPYGEAINMGTALAIVQGYYEEPGSPFKPYQVISRIEAVKVLLGSAGIMDWKYYAEVEAELGGLAGVLTQETVFADVHATRDYMWWYPRYLNKGCEIGLFNCTPDINFRPDDFVTEAEVLIMFGNLERYLNETGYFEERQADSDNDTLENYSEDKIYFTDKDDADTDTDLLLDGDELQLYLTSPFLEDSDFDRLTDYQEIMSYRTDPLKMDTDADGFSDFAELEAGTDPLSRRSFPQDDNENGVADEWEALFALNVPNGSQDSDGDGVSDSVEYQYGTNPLLVDTDGDGFTDAEELLQYKTNPLDAFSPADGDAVPVRISNFIEGQLVGDTTPFIQGTAPAGSMVRLLLQNDYGHEKVLGSTVADENNVFLFIVEEPLRDGRYMLTARALRPAAAEDFRVVDSAPVHIVIDSTLDVEQPVPERLDDVALTDDVLLDRVRVTIRNNRPVLEGTTDFGNTVTAQWRSVVLSSVLIADAADGGFTVIAPGELGFGEHDVWATATRRSDGAQSETVRVPFVIRPGLLGGIVLESGAGVEYHGAFEGVPVLGSLGQFVSQYGFLAWLLLGAGMLLLGAAVYYVVNVRGGKNLGREE